jgi:hypothetical protein
MDAGVAKAIGARSLTGPARSLKETLLVFLEVLVLAMWTGGMTVFSFFVAPSAFAVLPSSELAGAMVTSVLVKVEQLGMIAGPFLILVIVLAWRSDRSNALNRSLRLILLGAMSCAAALSHFMITPPMVTIRESLTSPIGELAIDDPLRLQFDSLHQYSVGLMSIAIFAGVAVLFLTLHSWSRR